MKIVELEVLEDIYAPNYYGCGSYEWCVNNNEFHLALKCGDKVFANLDKEFRFFGKRQISKIMKMLIYKTDFIDTRFFCYKNIVDCKKYNCNCSANVDVYKLKYRTEIIND